MLLTWRVRNCRPAAPLLIEGQLVLATEVEHGELPNAVLHAIAGGRTRHNLGQPWEAAFRDHVRRLATAGEIGEHVVAVGPFRTDDGGSEIDAVALAGRARRAIFAGKAAAVDIFG